MVEWPEYEAPAWLETIADAGPVEQSSSARRRLVARVEVLLYSTPEPPGADAPLLVAHDGPEYAQYAGLTRFLDAMSWEERIPPLRAALIQPVDRNETYSASALYAGALVRELLPQIAKLAPHGRRIGMGASLGALAMLHAHSGTRRPSTGCCCSRAASSASAGTSRSRTSPATGGSRASSAPCSAEGAGAPIPVAITCGTAEENRANNEAVAERSTRRATRRGSRSSATRTRGPAGATRSTRTCRR